MQNCATRDQGHVHASSSSVKVNVNAIESLLCRPSQGGKLVMTKINSISINKKHKTKPGKDGKIPVGLGITILMRFGVNLKCI